jgi:hypothetical protein
MVDDGGFAELVAARTATIDGVLAVTLGSSRAPRSFPRRS